MNLRPRGFTLLEVLVALAMLAIVMTAAFRGINLTAQQTAELGERHMAQWVAQNRLAELRMRQRFPDVGTTEGDVTQGELRFRWREEVRATDNALFRRVDVTVRNGAGVQLAKLIGFASRQ